MKKSLIKNLLMLFIVIFGSIVSFSKVIYVDTDATGQNNGTSWTDAYLVLQSALDGATVNDQIWVASGTYYPTKQEGGSGDRYRTLQMKNGVAIYGGFAGTEEQLTQRNWQNNETILNGDIGIEGDSTDNCYHIFYHPTGLNLNTTATLDGFTIINGNANGNMPHNYGGGIYNSYCNPKISNCKIIGNSASNYGGGIYNYSSSTIAFTNCFITNNIAPYGGGIYNAISNPIITNCIICENSASFYGGGIYNASCNSPQFINCTISENYSSFGGGFFNSSSNPIINNSIIYGNKAATANEIYISGGSTNINYSCYSNQTGDIYGTPTVINSINESPKFVGSSSINKYSLTGNSPCLDIGNNSYNNELYDLRGSNFSRKLNKTDGNIGIIDIGAYEFKYAEDPIEPQNIIYVKKDASGENNGKSWSNAYTDLQKAINKSIIGDQIWVAAGTYYPTKQVGGTGERFRAFQMKNRIDIYGGFIGNETLLSQRDFKNNETNLSGDIGIINDKSDNCYHVFYHSTDLSLNSTANIDGFTIRDGNSKDYGGGFYNSSCSPKITNCIIIGNSAYYDGGGLYNTSSNPSIINSSFLGNSAVNNGGGIFNTGSIPIINNCILKENSASNGGSIFNNSSNPIISNCTFTENYANSGAAVYNLGGKITITNCTISLNNASYYASGIYNNTCTSTISNCTLSGNTALYGSGIYNVGGNDTIINCIFSGNITSGSLYGGGGIYNASSNSVIANCTFISNSAFCGGSIYNSYSNATIINSLISENTATNGGGIYNIGGNPTITNCTIYNNNASSGGGIYNYSSNTSINNSIIWGNNAVNQANEIYISSSNTLLNYSCFSNQSGDIYGTPTVTNCLNIYPKFAGSLSGFEYSLAGNSPCLDAGNNIYNNEVYDLRGSNYPRKLNKTDGTLGIIDMGAYEYKYNTDPLKNEMILIPVSAGWNMISSNIIPSKPDSMQYVFSEIQDNLVIVKNNSGNTFIPSYDINDIGKWDITQGYQVYMLKSDTLVISGFAVNPSETQIVLNQGWNTISYLRKTELDCETAFAGLIENGNLIIVKDNEGNVFIPSYDINQIGNLVPGKGYQLYVLNSDQLVYPDN